jgi:hypothetical protein
MKRIARIDSYFSLPTDLAAEFRSYPEFRGGIDYDLDLQSQHESVTVRFHPADGDDRPHVTVTGEGDGRLFNTVLGGVVHALSMHSDDVMVCNWSGR